MIYNNRALASQILEEILFKQVSIDLAKTKLSALNLKASDQAQVMLLCFGVLRWYPALMYCCEQTLHQKFKTKYRVLELLICVGLYQLFYLDMPVHAAVFETVAATKALNLAWSKNCINAVLRRCLSDQENLLQNINNNYELKYSISSWLFASIKKSWPKSYCSILQHSNNSPALNLRINSQIISIDAYLALLDQAKLNYRVYPNPPGAIELIDKVNVSDIPGFCDGLVSVQDRAAQWVPELLQLTNGAKVLDACAAPGGKSGHVYEYMRGKINLLAIDIDARRLEKIHQNKIRLKQKYQTKCADVAKISTWWDGKLFDCIMLDAPCSGSGVMRRHPDIKQLRTVIDLENLVAIQANLLATLLPLVKVGGQILYSTCSILPAENDAIIRQVLQFNPNYQIEPLNISFGQASEFGWQILPDHENTDGFYYCKLIRKQ